MCGIVGVFGNLNESINTDLSKTILETLANRGPDNQSIWTCDKYTLGHTRLSIIGLGKDSNQPYKKTNSNWIMIFNGEIYNYKELKAKLILNGCNFESNSDTEVLYRGFCEHGSSFFSQIRGMFAVAFFNPDLQKLVLARDFSGEKPLYYRLTNDSIVFSSCISTIEACSAENLVIDEISVERYLHYQFIPSHRTIFSEIVNLTPGSILEISLPNLEINEKVIKAPTGETFLDKSHALSLIKGNFRTAVERTLTSDVPIALSLSGGMDSVAIAAQIRDIDPHLEITSFTAGYEGEFDFDERMIARRVAGEFGFNHIELEISKKDFIEDFPRFMQTMNSPIADLAAYPQFRIAEAMNKNDFKVGILGIGGDELFWGYQWAIETLERPNNSRTSAITPFKNHKSIKQWLSNARYDFYNKKFSIQKATPAGFPVFYEQLGDFNSPFVLKSKFLNPKVFSESASMYDVISRVNERDSPQIRFQSILSDNWLTCNSLALADSLGMSNSVEYRLPFLDLDLVGLSKMLTREMFQESKNKNLLREALFDLIPGYVKDRDKSGFRFPSNLWLPELFNRYEEELIKGQLVSRGWTQGSSMRKLLQGSKRTWSKKFMLYKLLVLEFYLENHSKHKTHE